jgi:hypothetical protein
MQSLPLHHVVEHVAGVIGLDGLRLLFVELASLMTEAAVAAATLGENAWLIARA